MLNSKFAMPSFVFFVFLSLGFLSQDIYGCSCIPVSSGMEYLNAKGVYKGRLIRTEPGERFYMNSYFDIYHTYKGGQVKTLTLVYPNTDCRKPFEVGRSYLIYQEAGEVQRFCNRTDLISDLKQDIEHLDRFNTEKPLLTIRGFISVVPNELLSKVRGKIRSRDGELEITIDKVGSFKEIIRKKQNYTVLLSFPAPAQGHIEIQDGGVWFDGKVNFDAEKQETILEYDVDLTQTFADYRQIRIGIPAKENKLSLGSTGLPHSNLITSRFPLPLQPQTHE